LTQQYIVGELSSLLAGLQPAPRRLLGDAVGTLRHDVEFSSLPMLPELAMHALDLTDEICQAALEEGDAEAFCRYVATAIALREFTTGAGLLP
jgi:hypothetical protein